MTHRDDYSDEYLNAYIDGELTPDETGRLLDELRYNEILSARITDLQKVREMVRYAYQGKTPPQHSGRKLDRMKKSRMALAASILLSVGMALGWGLHLHSPMNSGLLDIAQAMQISPVASKKDDEIKLVLHVTTGSKHKLDTVLDEAETFLSQYEHTSKKVQLDILTNGQGLTLLRADHSPYGERIKKLQERYKNLTFKACQNAIRRAQQQAGKEVPMLPETVTVPSALGEIMRKQQEGWSYIKI